MTVRSLIWSRTTATWAILVAATLLTWTLARAGLPWGRRAEGCAVLIIACFKVRLVLLEFMEIRDASLVFRLAAEIWVIALCVTLIGLYL